MTEIKQKLSHLFSEHSPQTSTRRGRPTAADHLSSKLIYITTMGKLRPTKQCRTTELRFLRVRAQIASAELLHTTNEVLGLLPPRGLGRS
jgi:hypothetical protein